MFPNHRTRQSEHELFREQQRQLEEQLRQARQLVSIGKMAESIARELDQPSLDTPPREFGDLLQHYEALLKAAHEPSAGIALAGRTEATRAQVSEQVVLNLCRLIVALTDFRAQTSSPASSSGGREEELINALQNTIDVLASTKRAFKSRTLGQLRERLAKLLEPRTESDSPDRESIP